MVSYNARYIREYTRKRTNTWLQIIKLLYFEQYKNKKPNHSKSKPILSNEIHTN